MNEHQYLLRPEAHPIAWAKQTYHQRVGLEKLLKSLRVAVNQLPAHSVAIHDEHDYPLAQHDRFSRMMFLDGRRGTGKTSLDLTLVDILNPQCDDSRYEGGYEVLSVARQIRNRVIVLDSLAMEPLPAGTPILSAILARIDRAAHRLGVPRNRRRGLLDDDISENKNYKEFYHLRSQIARSLDSNLAGRGSHLDREQYGVEVMNQEEDRLCLPERLARSLNLLSLAISKELRIPRGRDDREDKPFLFLVRVDDIDLNPDRCLELLQLLRHYSVPQLFFVLTGQRELVENIVRSQICSHYSKAGDVSSGLSSVDTEKLRQRLAEVALANIQKIIPNVVELPLIPMDEVLNFVPLKEDDMEVSP